ncbi:MAG: hypothetical protein AAF632_19025 [Bacteroidota bacterium]
MKSNLVLGLIWLGFSVVYISSGIMNIYQYSNPSILWLYMIPDEISYSKVLIGIFSFLIGTSIIRNDGKNTVLLFLFALLLLAYVVIDFIQLRTDTLYMSGGNILLFLLTAITIRFFYKTVRIKSAWNYLKENRKVVIIVLGVGLAPYILRGWITYSLFHFLH